MIFPGDTNHHGTLFGGVALAHMDKVAFLTATRHGRAPFVTACSERIDFNAPGFSGEIVEVSGQLTRVGRSSLDVEVTVTAEALVSGERRTLTRGLFTMVARKGPETRLPLPPMPPRPAIEDENAPLRMVEMVFPTSTNHHGNLFGGDAMKMMGKAAFIAATRFTREIVVMASSSRIDFTSPIREGAMIELIPRVRMAGRSSLLVEVQMWSEELLTGARNHAATARFTMVSVDEEGKSKPFTAATPL
ncbi:acyl-CoA thioesterase [Novosphingobium profundi]|nr:acyl-CoA thioesterase [Novosphingobium profundi]